MAFPIFYQKVQDWLAAKANKTETYTKTEVDEKITASGTGITDSIKALENSKADKSSLAAVATSGSYSDLSNKPTLGTLASKDSVAFSEVTGTEKVRTTDTKLTLNDFSGIDLGMVGE